MSIRSLFRQHVSKFVNVKPFIDPRDSKAKQEEADREIEREWRRRIARNEYVRQQKALRKIAKAYNNVCMFHRRQAG